MKNLFASLALVLCLAINAYGVEPEQTDSKTKSEPSKEKAKEEVKVGWTAGDKAFTKDFISGKDDPIKPVSESPAFSEFNNEKYKTAITKFQEELQSGAAANPAETRWFLSVALFKKDQAKEAVEVLEKLLKTHPDSPYVPLALGKLGEIAEDNKDEKKALSYYEKIFYNGSDDSKNYRQTPAGRAIGVRLGNIYYKTYCVKPNIDKSKWWMVREAYSMSYPFLKDPKIRKTVRERLDQVNQYLLFSPAGVDTKYIINHAVKENEGLDYLARKVYMLQGMLSLVQWNAIENPDQIIVGQVLKIFRGKAMIIAHKNDFTLTLYLDGLYVKEYKIAVGKDDKTPTGDFTVIKLDDHPSYTKDKVTYEFGAKENVVGTRWIGIGQSYGIHGTSFPESIGKRASKGCIRMHNKDVEEVYSFVRMGDKVIIAN